MAQATEAACLLHSGATYPSRVGFRLDSGDDGFVGIRAGGFSMFAGDAPIFHWDFEGRWQRAFIEGTHYLKGLDAEVHAIDRVREGSSLVLRRRALGPEEGIGLDATIRNVAIDLLGTVAADRLATLAPPPPALRIGLDELRDLLGRVAAWDAAAWAAHRERHAATYGPWPFLPPDCPTALVLQATSGEGGVFGDGAAGGPLARPVAGFEHHARDVRSLMGRRLAQSRDVFLAGPGVLRRPVDDVLGLLEATARVFPVGLAPSRARWAEVDQDAARLETIHALLDDFGPGRPDLDGWRTLREARLGRVTLGVESAVPSVRARFGKSWSDDDLGATVADLKAAGIGVGLVLLVGSGGRATAPAHLEAASRLVGALPMGRGDLVTLVDDRLLGPDPLDDGEVAGQVAEFKRRWAAGRASPGARVVAYNPDKQSTWATARP